MKHTIKAMAALFLMLFALQTNARAQNILRLENNTNHDIWAAYATYDVRSASDRCWICNGWIKVEKYNTRDINVGQYTGQFFVHGENRAQGVDRNWGDNDMLCVEEGEAFSIRCPRNVQCKIKKMFALINSSQDGITKFIFNP